ncbi:MAG TPA: ROK family protein [Gemmatimonadaceae bacterium]|nr:ROK family protein [Gemmatimonadaceae bacterium]
MRLAAAVDIGATNTKIGVVGEDGHVFRRNTIPTRTGNTPSRLVDAIAGELRPMMDAMTDERNQVVAIGVSIAGFLNREHTMMIANANLPELRDFPLRRAFEEKFELNCHLEVDSNATTLAEYRFGMGRRASNLLGMVFGTGVGGGVIIGGRLLRFTGECVGDIGHVIVEPGGHRCTCGGRGCLEAVANSAALSERAEGRSPREVIGAAKAGEASAIDALATTGQFIGLGLASLVQIFAPERIVIGGGIAAAGEVLIEPAREAFRASAGDDFRDNVSIVCSTFEGWEGIIGAASLALSPHD